MLSSGADGVPQKKERWWEVKIASIRTEKSICGGNIGMSVVL